MPEGILTLMLLGTTLAMGGCSAAKPAPVTTAAAAITEAKKAWEAVHKQLPSDGYFDSTNVARFEPYTATLLHHEWHVVSSRSHASQDHPPEAFIGEIDGTRWVAIK